MKSRLLFMVLALGAVSPALGAQILSLAGEWGFTPDFQRRGEASGWPDIKPTKGDRWENVTVPHSFSGGDPRYEHTGAAWYVRTFEVPREWTGSHLRLRFASVGDRCRVWLNGKFLGAHDGVNLPFSFDVTSQVERGGRNHLVLEVDNSFSDETLPGSRPGKAPNTQVYPWWNYGGIFGAVTLESEPSAHIGQWRTRYEFKSDGAVAVTFRTKLENRGAAGTYTLAAQVTPPSPGAAPIAVRQPVQLAATSSAEAALTLTIPAALVRRWNLDQPVLYSAELTLGGADGTKHTVRRRLGLREVAVRNAQLLLNGEPVRLAGTNRSRGHPKWGGLEPAELAALDLSMMKRGHLEFTRLQHYPIAEPLLDWADEHGLLIVAESGNWQLEPAQLASPKMRALWQQQMREMIENSWDRPSVIAWSVGNEYISWSAEGMAWTRDMAAWVRTLEDTRPVTFCAQAEELAVNGDVPRENRSLHYVDFMSLNIYGSPSSVARLDRIHALWPEKPIMVSEFGQRADLVKDESVRIQHFRGTLEIVRARPYICGLSFWTFNDYLSRYPGTTPGGYRAWGLVTGARSPRDLYSVLPNDLSPVAITVQPDGKNPGLTHLTVTSRADFPSTTLRGYRLRITPGDGRAAEETLLPDLPPGKSWTKDFAPWPAGATAEVIRPGGWRAFLLQP